MRTLYPIVGHRNGLVLSARSVRNPYLAKRFDGERQLTFRNANDSGESAARRTPEEQGYFERLQSCIPVEVLAVYITISNQIDTPRDANGITPDGWVALASVATCSLACLVYSSVAAKQIGSPAFWTHGLAQIAALLIWIYATDSVVLEALDHQQIPALSTLLIGAFTLFCGFLIPTTTKLGPPEEDDVDEPPDDGLSTKVSGQNLATAAAPQPSTGNI